METNGNVNLSISKEIVNPIVEAKIKAAVVEATKKLMKKYLPLYYNCMAEGLPGAGLCNVFGYFEGMDEIFDLMRPELDELETAPIWGYWGMDGDGGCGEDKEDESGEKRNGFDFTPLRQNIVLLMACLNNEL